MHYCDDTFLGDESITVVKITFRCCKTISISSYIYINSKNYLKISSSISLIEENGIIYKPFSTKSTKMKLKYLFMIIACRRDKINCNRTLYFYFINDFSIHFYLKISMSYSVYFFSPKKGLFFIEKNMAFCFISEYSSLHRLNS